MIAQWANYFIAVAGGAAALAGLIFVSVSLNLKTILAGSFLAGRALGTLVLLINILISGSFCLIPGRPLRDLGISIIISGLVVWVMTTRLDIKMYRAAGNEYRVHYVRNLIFTQLAILPFIAGGFRFFMGSIHGADLIVYGVTFSFIKAILDAWVLLVEINR